jgi:EAL domain-containing protein (putative c-di-GMP-specific phosphodiesterase class I)
MHCASLALRAAKAAGGACLRVYTREIEMAGEVRLRLEKAITEGLRENWFSVNFQPQYDLESRRLTGFEALARMDHPQLGSIAPAVFLPVAEETGLMRQLGDWIFEAAVNMAREWPEHLELAVNLSTAQFQAPDLSRRMLEVMARHAFDPKRLRLEISETVLASAGGGAARQLGEFRAAGTTIVIDDFGVAGLGFEALARSPCDAIKIDRSFMNRVGEDPAIDSAVRSLISAANSLDLMVVAEGIERAEQAHFLMTNDCKGVQGYLFGRPAEPSEVAAIIAKDLRKTVAEATQEPGLREATARAG